jgi:hypothetical protein
MDYYFTYMSLLGLRSGNMPPFRDARLKRYKSVKKMVDLIATCTKLAPAFPTRIFSLDPFDGIHNHSLSNHTIPDVQPNGTISCPSL